MSTGTDRVAPIARWNAERQFFAGTALSMLVITFLGFSPSYYLAPARITAAPAIIHLHAAVFTGWILLYVLQNLLIASGRRDLHRGLGIAGAFLVPAVVVTGYCTVILTEQGGTVAGRLGVVPIIFPFSAATAFGILAAIGLARRADAATHKRLMFLATTSLIVTPFARIARRAGSPLPPPINGMLLSDLFVAALFLFDWRRNGRLHPATLWGGGLLLLSQPLRVAIDRTGTWQAIAAWLLR